MSKAKSLHGDTVVGEFIDKLITEITSTDNPTQCVIDCLTTEVLPNKELKKRIDELIKTTATGYNFTPPEDAEQPGGKFSDGLQIEGPSEKKLQPLFSFWNDSYKPEKDVPATLLSFKDFYLPDRSRLWPEEVITNFTCDCRLQAAYKKDFEYDDDTKQILFAYTHSQLGPSFFWASWETDHWNPFDPVEGSRVEDGFTADVEKVVVHGQEFQQQGSHPEIGITLFENSIGKTLLRYSNPRLGDKNLSPLHDNVAWLPSPDHLPEYVRGFGSFPVSGVLEFLSANPPSDHIHSEEKLFADASAQFKWKCVPYVNERTNRVINDCVAEENQQAYNKKLQVAAEEALRSVDDPNERSILTEMYNAGTGHDPKAPPESIARALTFQKITWKRCGDGDGGDGNEEQTYFVAFSKTTTETRTPHILANAKTAEISKIFRMVSNYWPNQIYNLSNQATRMSAWGSPMATYTFDFGQQQPRSKYEAQPGDCVFRNNNSSSGGTAEFDVNNKTWKFEPKPTNASSNGVGVVVETSLGGWLLPQFKEYVYHTHVALELVSQKGGAFHKTYRGMRGSLSRKEYALGSTVVWPQPSSTTFDQGYAAGFASGNSEAVVFTLKTNYGAKLQRISRFARESEILLKLNTCFKVTGELTDQHSQILDKSGIQLFDLQEISNKERIAIHARRALALATGVSSCTLVFHVIDMINDESRLLDLSPKSNGGRKSHVGDTGAKLLCDMIEMGIPVEGFNLQETGIKSVKVLEACLSVVGRNPQITFAKCNSSDEAISLVALAVSSLVSLRAALNKPPPFDDSDLVAHIPRIVIDRDLLSPYMNSFKDIKGLPVLSMMHIFPDGWSQLKKEWPPLPPHPLHLAAGKIEKAVIPLIENLMNLSSDLKPQQSVVDDDGRAPFMCAIRNDDFLEWSEAGPTLAKLLPDSPLTDQQGNVILRDFRDLNPAVLKKSILCIIQLLTSDMKFWENIPFWENVLTMEPKMFDDLPSELQERLKKFKPRKQEKLDSHPPSDKVIPTGCHFYDEDYKPTGKFSTISECLESVFDLRLPTGAALCPPEYCCSDYLADSEYRVWEVNQFHGDKYHSDTIKTIFMWCHFFTKREIRVCSSDGENWSEKSLSEDLTREEIFMMGNEGQKYNSGYQKHQVAHGLDLLYSNPYPEDRRFVSYLTNEIQWFPNNILTESLAIPCSGVIDKITRYQLDACFDSNMISNCLVSKTETNIEWSVKPYDGDLADEIKNLIIDCRSVSNQSKFNQNLLRRCEELFDLKNDSKALESSVFSKAVKYIKAGDNTHVIPQAIDSALQFQYVTWLGTRYLLTGATLEPGTGAQASVILGDDNDSYQFYSFSKLMPFTSLSWYLNKTTRELSTSPSATHTSNGVVFKASSGETVFKSDEGSQINGADISMDDIQIGGWLISQIRPYLYHMSKALTDIKSLQPEQHAQRLYRTLRAQFKGVYEKGMGIVWHSLSPATESKSAADRFASADCTVFVINTSSGVDIRQLEMQRFGEVICPANSFFQISEHVDGKVMGGGVADTFVLDEVKPMAARTATIRHMLASNMQDLNACEIAFAAINMVENESTNLDVSNSQINLKPTGVDMISKLISLKVPITSLLFQNTLVGDEAASSLLDLLCLSKSDAIVEAVIHSDNEEVGNKAMLFGRLCALRARIHQSKKREIDLTDMDVSDCLSGYFDWVVSEGSVLNRVLDIPHLRIPRISLIHIFGSTYHHPNPTVTFSMLPPYPLHIAARYFEKSLQFLLSAEGRSLLKEEGILGLDEDPMTMVNDDNLFPIECAIENVNLDNYDAGRYARILRSLIPDGQRDRILRHREKCTQRGVQTSLVVCGLLDGS